MALLESSTKPESPGVFKASNYPSKSLNNWHGRKEEIANLKQWLNDHNIALIGIEGIGGTGKSMLASKIYDDETIENFPKRFWADVSYGAIFTDVAAQVLKEFGFPVPEKETELIQSLVKCLQSSAYLLIIDNLESQLTTDGKWESQFYQQFFTTWVECGGKSKVIVTTRERPELPTRFQWLPLLGLKVADGVELLTSLGIEGNLEEFVKLVAGYPLVLQFVADLLKVEYPQDPNLQRLENLGLGNLQQLLTGPKLQGVHRREYMAMVLVLDASFSRLSDFQKSLLQNISVYRGMVNAKAAMAVYPGSSETDLKETDLETELRNLVRRSFLSEKLIDNCRWFEFQPVVLEYVRYKAGDQTAAHQKAINYYRSIAKQSDWQTKDDIQEYLEIFYHFYQLADYNSAFEEIRRCNDFLTLRGYYANQVELYGQLVSKWSEIGDTENWNYQASLISLGNAYNSLGQYQTAIDFLQQSLVIARKIGDVQGESISLNNLGNAYNSLGQYQTTIDFLQQSLVIARKIGDVQEESNSLIGLGNAYKSLGQYQTAIDFYQQSLVIVREIGDVQGESNSLNNLGNAYNSLGQYQTAIDFLQQSLVIARQIGAVGGESNSLIGLGNAYNSLGQYQTAIDFYQQSLVIVREIGAVQGESNSLNNLGNAYYSLGQYQTAIDFLQQSLVIARKIGDVRGESNSLNNLGNAYYFLGQYQTAVDFFQQSLVIKKQIGDVQGESNSLNNLGNAYNSLGQYQTAIDFFQQSLVIKKQIGDVQGETASLNNLGNAYNSLGQYQTAIDFFQQSLVIKKQIGDVQGESASLIGLGNAYNSLGQYQTAIDFYQQSLVISRQIGAVQGEALAWFNLGVVLETVDREADALGAYRNARGLYETMGLDTQVQDCNDKIEELSQSKKPVVSRLGFWSWLGRLWRWVRGWFKA